MTVIDSSPASNSQPNNRSRYWRSLSELQQSDDFKQYLHREFPVAASEFPEGVSRRRWLQLMGASLALAGVSGCRYPQELIAPFVIRPEDRIPGEFYSRATNFELAGRTYHLLVRCVDGRPSKVEPNELHPAGGGTDAYVQASMLSLYDPDRSRGDDGVILRRNGGNRPEQLGWDAFETSYGPGLLRTAAANAGGVGFAVLIPPTASPTTVRMVKRLREKLPQATFARFDGVFDDTMRRATTEVLGQPARQTLALQDAEVIVTIQADILGNDPGFIANARGYAATRDPLGESMSRMYVVEGGFSQTGAAADSRLAIRPSQMPALLSELQRRVEANRGNDAPADESPDPTTTAYDELEPAERLERFLAAAAQDLARAGEKAVVVVGEHLGPEAVAAGIRFNQSLGSLGKLQKFRALPDAELGEMASLAELVERINGGGVDDLLILGGNPVFTAPADVDFASALGNVEHSIYLGEYDDETAAKCGWSLPLAHPLESWDDCVDDAGHYGICQPNILPLLGGRTVAQVLAIMLGEPVTDPLALVRQTADQVGSGGLNERQWRKLLHYGFDESLVWGDELSEISGSSEPLTADAPVAASEVDLDDVEVIFVPADGLYDGRFANNAWLQEMPQSLTKLTWGNAAILSPATAAALDIEHGMMVGLRREDDRIDVPVFVMPGCAPGVVTLPIGYGRTRAGMVGGLVSQDVDAVGSDVRPIRLSGAMLVAYNLEARRNETVTELATTQDHWAIDELGREETEARSFSLVREGTTKLLEKIPEFVDSYPKAPHVPQVGETGSPFTAAMDRIREEHPQLPQWGMAIDLSKCIGCNACVVACQSENNVPVVGKEQVLKSREMHWLRIDRYFQGDADNAEVVQEPMACQHCETAPCEQVCPVAATVHTEEGLNAMAYNRCIGTRYCANNCPFKVRRFNYFNYNEDVGVGYGIDAYQSHIENASRKLQQLVLNPDVTTRGRGVMEKCTYCVQRIEQAKIAARRDGGRPVADGEIVTACQSACPTKAIEFGNIADPESRVSQQHANPRSYGMLSQINVKPRTEYLARIRNPHPSLMTRAQLHDLATIEPPHHGHEAGGSHGAGETHHGESGHGESNHETTPETSGDGASSVDHETVEPHTS